MYDLLGPPDRVDSGTLPAPVGHRNGLRHIYDALGITMNEHHYTYRITCVDCWFSSSDPEYDFTPKCDFAGHIVVDGKELSLRGDVRGLLADAPVEFEGGFGGRWHYAFDGFCIFVSSRGRLLPSGRRSKVRNVTSVSISWPHDPWQKPEISVTPSSG
ncbi:DUF7738 domain-containing protein [Pirellulimonas nuda]